MATDGRCCPSEVTLLAHSKFCRVSDNTSTLIAPQFFNYLVMFSILFHTYMHISLVLLVIYPYFSFVFIFTHDFLYTFLLQVVFVVDSCDLVLQLQVHDLIRVFVTRLLYGEASSCHYSGFIGTFN